MTPRDRPMIPSVTTIPATEVRNHFGEMLKRVYSGTEQLVVEKDGLPIAAILSHAEFEEYRRMKSLYLLEQLNRAVNKDLESQGYTEEQALKDLRAIKKTVYRETYGKSRTRRPKKTR